MIDNILVGVSLFVYVHLTLSLAYWAFDLAQSTYRKRKTNKALEEYAKENIEDLSDGSLFHKLGVKLQLSDKQKIVMLAAMLEETK